MTTLPFPLPDEFNAASYFVDRHITEGRGDKVAIECEDRRVTYRELFQSVNQVGNALKKLDVRAEERIFLLLHDTPEFAASFFGAIKIGAVPVPVNTLLKPSDYEFLLNDSRARVAIVSAPLFPLVEAIPSERLRYIQTFIVIGDIERRGAQSFDRPFTGKYRHVKDNSACTCAGWARWLARTRSSIRAPAGRASTTAVAENVETRRRTAACSCDAPRCSARTAEDTSATCSTTDRRRPGFATASTPARSTSRHSPTSPSSS